MKKIYLLLLLALFTIHTFAQTKEDTTDRQFHDDLLDHLVGKWNVTAMAHGSPFTCVLKSGWVLNHQHLHIYLKGNEVVPWIGVPMEFEYFIGYSKSNKRYVVHEMNVFGYDNPYEGLCYAYRNANELKLIKKFSGADSLIVQKFTWQPASRSWHVETRLVIGGKEEDIFLEMKLVAIKPSQKRKPSLSK